MVAIDDEPSCSFGQELLHLLQPSKARQMNQNVPPQLDHLELKIESIGLPIKGEHDIVSQPNYCSADSHSLAASQPVR